MKLLLTGSGVTNPSIRTALLGLLGTPIEEATALHVPTALHALPGGAVHARRAICGLDDGTPMTQLGWKSVGVLELTALPSIGADLWVPQVRAADVLLVSGGDPMFLSHWMRVSGLADLFPSLPDLVYVGLSAGSMALTPSIGETFVEWQQPGGGDRTLGLVDFSVFPHLNHPEMPENTLAEAETWAAAIGRRAYAIDDETAIVVAGGTETVVSEGTWTAFSS